MSVRSTDGNFYSSTKTQIYNIDCTDSQITTLPGDSNN